MTHPPTIADAQNPLCSDWTGPFGLPPFGVVTPEHFRPAFDATMAAHPTVGEELVTLREKR